ncbi:hypothetical protein Q8F57_018675 [Paraburkholderia terrae]|nr:hypothetical protein [Paraburkholderia terrae]MDW3655129.1 hypothetical protein [Paraburkholderia terrae]
MFTAFKVVLSVVLVSAIGYTVYTTIAPTFQTIVQTLHNATLDNRGLHD